MTRPRDCHIHLPSLYNHHGTGANETSFPHPSTFDSYHPQPRRSPRPRLDNRPLAAEFTNASLNVNYAVFNSGRGGDSPQAGVSVPRYDGMEHFPVSLFKMYQDLL